MSLYRICHGRQLPLQKLIHAIYRHNFSCKKKNQNFMRNFDVFFFIFAQNIGCGYTLEPLPTIYVLDQKYEK